MPTERLLVANRGEIASRVIRTGRAMGLHTIAVYSDADVHAPFVHQAHEAHRIGPAAATESYLDLDKIMAVAESASADMIHPGYGFLSENTALASRCESAGIRFIGPPADAISAMGDKTAAKVLMEKAGVPLVPGYHGDNQDPAHLEQAAAKTGYPLMIKASAGGGGKGMRVVHEPSRFAEELAGAKREAMNAFGSDHVLLERFVEAPRHVEVQVFFDQQGNGVFLFDRDCSIQRRHQKIIEEAPAPGLTEALRQAMGEAAVRCGQAIDYVGAGTVEFLLDPSGDFFFMEMNTRLQVEHPVTEAITGIDLVEWQIRIARGEALPWQQSDLRIQGHAVEARVYAENPDEDFLPTSGHIHYLREPVDLPGIRVDSGIAQGLDISPWYDPMVAKVIAHGPDRDTAITRLSEALETYHLAGPVINLAYIHRILATEAFRAGDLRTDFIPEHEEILDQPAVSEDLRARLTLICWLASGATSASTAQQDDPWQSLTGWRLGPPDLQKAEVLAGDHVIPLFYGLESLTAHSGSGVIGTQETAERFSWETGADNSLSIRIAGGVPLALSAVSLPATAMTLFCQGDTWSMKVNHPELADAVADAGSMTAPMHGRIIAVNIGSGDQVKAGEALVVMEAMKMEHTLTAPADGQVTALHAAAGDNVAAGQVVLAFEPTPEEAP